MNESLLVSHPERDRRPLRFIAFGLIGILVFGLLTTRLAYLQLSNGPEYAAQAEANRTAEVAVPAPRGLIYDRTGRLLVANVATFTVKIRPADLPFSRREDVTRRLGGLLGMDPSDIISALDSAPGSRFDQVRIAQDVPEATARIVAESVGELPGVAVAVETRREYPDGPLLAHILGYTGPIDGGTLEKLASSGYLADDTIGKAGVEATFESALRGTYGVQLMERDATGRDIQVLQTLQDAVPGASLTLTVDRKVQAEATAALKWGMKAAGLQRGVFIVMNPQTGEILALVSLPGYDNNLFAKGISNKDFKALLTNKNKPLTNHAVQAHYPPGLDLQAGRRHGRHPGQEDHGHHEDPDQALPAPGFHALLRLESPRLRGLRHLLRVRSFVGYVLLPGRGHARCGPPRLLGRMYGFGKPTGIELPGEAAGIVPSNQWKIDALGQPMFAGEVYQSGIGQGYDVVTPIQLINAYAALANGGKLYRPQLVREIVGPDGTAVRAFKPELIRKLPVSAKTLRSMRLAARSTVTLRHTYNLVDMPVKVAGKSGTAEFGTRDSKGRLPYSSWFVGWVGKNPYKADFAKTDSQLMFLAFAYDSRTKGNAATEIAKSFLQLHFHIKKDYLNRDLLKRGNFYQSN